MCQLIKMLVLHPYWALINQLNYKMRVEPTTILYLKLLTI